MENRNLEKALDIVSALMMGDSVGKESNAALYEEYTHNAEVYDVTGRILSKMNISLYEYNDSLFISAGVNNRVFGFSNEELKRLIGLRLNKELFLTYFIMYNVITEFYKDSQTGTYLEYLRAEDVINAVNTSLLGLIDHSMGIVMEEAEEESFKAMALLWDELPDVSVDDKSGYRAARNSRMGFVKLTFNFLMGQKLFTESEERYYPTDRFRAIARNYFENNRGRLYEIMNGGAKENAAD